MKTNVLIISSETDNTYYNVDLSMKESALYFQATDGSHQLFNPKLISISVAMTFAGVKRGMSGTPNYVTEEIWTVTPI